MATLTALAGGCAGPEPPVSVDASEPAPPSGAALDEMVASAGRTAFTPIDWASAPDCLVALRWLHDAAHEGRLAPEETIPIALILPEPAAGRSWIEPASLQVASDLPIQPIGTAGSLHAADYPCVVEVGAPRDQRADHRLVARDQVRSLYESGVRSQRNPEYEVARARVRQLERQLKEDDSGVLMVGDPVLDLLGIAIGGLISGFSRGGHEDELDEAMMALAATPRSVDRPVYRAYHFERAVVRAGREAVVPVALHDRTQGSVRRTHLRQRERREFVVLDGLDPRDKDYEQWHQSSVDLGELRRWLEAPPQVPSSTIVQALLEAPDGRFEALPPDLRDDRAETIHVGLPPRAMDRIADQPEDATSHRKGEPLVPPAEPLILDVEADPLDSEDPDRFDVAEDDLDDGDRPVEDSDRVLDIDLDQPFRSAGPLLDGWSEPIDGETIEVGGRNQHRRVHARRASTAADSEPPAGASMVRIAADGRTGRGFYVGHDLVLTTRRLIAGAVVVDVTTADGTTVLGVVARTDPVHDLALLHVPRTGEPIVFEGEPGDVHGPGAIALGRRGEAGLAPAALGGAPAAEGQRGGASIGQLALVPAATLLAFIKGPPAP